MGISIRTVWISHLTSQSLECQTTGFDEKTQGYLLNSASNYENLSSFPVLINTHNVESERLEAIEKAGIQNFLAKRPYENEISGTGVAIQPSTPVVVERENLPLTSTSVLRVVACFASSTNPKVSKKWLMP